MRFCTTHRACAVGNHADDPFCEVASVWPSWLPLNSPEPCTLVDALIVTKDRKLLLNLVTLTLRHMETLPDWNESQQRYVADLEAIAESLSRAKS